MKIAAWYPVWYGDDPDLRVGLTSEFAFYKHIPDYASKSDNLVLCCRYLDGDNIVIGRGTIASIYHPELGYLVSVKHGGLVCKYTLIDGCTIDVDTEEALGEIFAVDEQAWHRSWTISERFQIEFEKPLVFSMPIDPENFFSREENIQFESVKRDPEDVSVRAMYEFLKLVDGFDIKMDLRPNRPEFSKFNSVPENEKFDVELVSVGARLFKIMSLLCILKRFSLKEAKNLMDNLPGLVVQDVSAQKAEGVKYLFEFFGATVVVR